MQRIESASDTSWNDRFKEIPFSQIASNEWYGTSTDEDLAQRAQAKREFIDDPSLEEPNIHYPKLANEHVFDATEKAYQALLNEASTDAEYTKAARRLAELYRHKEVIRGLGRTGARAALSHDRAADMSAETFGEVDRDAYLGLINKLRMQAIDLQDEMPEARELLDMLGDSQPEAYLHSPELTRETLQTLHDDLNELFPGIYHVLTVDADREKMLPKESVRKFEQLLNFMHLTEKGWTVKMIPGSEQAASTNSNEKTITIGEKRAEFSPMQLIKTAGHEVVGHAFRSEGDTSQASLAFEEAFSVALEQIITNELRKGSGEQYYTALGLQYGLDQDGQRRSHRETFEVLWRRLMVRARAEGQEVTQEKAQDQAYTQVYRTRRGNAIDTRDRSYFEGARIVPEWANKVAELPKEERLKVLKWVLSGRFDPTNPEQVERYPMPN